MTEDQLKEIEARAAKATKGPWDVPKLDDGGRANIVGSKGRAVFMTLCHGSTDCEDNAAFIAAARTDVPALVAVLREARASNAILVRAVNAKNESLHIVERDYANARKQRDEARAERALADERFVSEREMTRIMRIERDARPSPETVAKVKEVLEHVEGLLERSKKARSKGSQEYDGGLMRAELGDDVREALRLLEGK